MRGLIAGLADTDRFTLASQLAILHNCPEALSKLIRNGDMVLLAAKVLVISRLLYKKLTQRPKPPPYLDILRNRLANLRRKLLDKIDRRFQALELTGTALIEAMCAFSLATSSSATDVLRHFHHIRLEAMEHQGQKNNDSGQGSSQALRVYVKTLKDTKTYLPGQLATTLQNLKTLPFWKSRDLQSLVELNLEAHEEWISDDIKMFTPYVRHDDLQKSEASRSLKEWAEHASASFFVGLRNKIKFVDNFAVIMQLRTQLLQLWLSNSQHSLGVEISEVLDGIRNAFNARCMWLIQAQTKSLENVAFAAEEKMQHWQKSQPNLCASLWDSSLTSMEIVDGGKAFTNTLLDRSRGRDEALMAISLDYRAWFERIEKIEEMIIAMRKIRWEDIADETDANDDDLLDKQVLLSEDDPQLLQDKLRECLHESFSVFSNSVRAMAAKISEPDGGPQAVYLLRIWRELRHNLPSTFQNNQYLGLDSINTLHDILATSAVYTPLQTCEQRLKKSLHGTTLMGRPLWEGNPELPVLPSSWTFRFLTELISSMTGLGVDIWSLRATNVLKWKLKVQLEAVLRSAMAAPIVKEQLANGDAAVDEPTKNRGEWTPEADQQEDEQQEDSKDENPAEIEASPAPQQTPTLDSRIQLLFDLLYLSHAFILIPSPGEGNGIEAQLSIVGETGLSEGSVKRIRRDVEGYWKRSCVLFGLLGS